MAAQSVRNSLDDDPVEVDLPMHSSPQSLSKALYARRADYTRPQKIKIKIGSWNVAACSGTEKDLAGWFVQGKGIDKRLAGLEIANAIDKTGSQANIETVEEQEARRQKKQPTIPNGDEGIITGGDEIGLYVLGLQEVVELASAKEYIGRVYSDTGPVTKWRKALSEALPEGYTLIAEQQMSGLLMFIYASPTIAPTISSVSTVSVGTGFIGYLGNKGAVTTRIVLGETTRLVFVNSHLASGADPSHLERRVWDVSQILQRTRFEPISRNGVLDDTQECIGDEDFAFWFGDLNFRLEGLPGDDIRRLLMLHTKGEYDIGSQSRKKIEKEIDADSGPIVIKSVDSDDESEDNQTQRSSGTFDYHDDASSDATTLPDPDDFIQDPSQDPASLQATIDSLLPHDQLRHVQKSKRAFHDGWREGPVTFLPTYKYDLGRLGVFDSSEKRRAPSWCDRILYRTRKDKLEYDGKQQDEELARKRDAEMKARGIDQAADDEDVLFDYDPSEDGDNEPTPPAPTDDYDEYDEAGDIGEEAVLTKEGYLDRIHLDVYTSHQRVLSSDHKPLAAIFSLEYDAVIPELKAKVQQEVARELDRAENEARPGITIVVDRSQDAQEESQNSSRRESDNGTGVVDFGEVEFGRRKTRHLTIANTSQVTSTFAFVDRPGVEGEEDRIAPQWMSIYCTGSDMDEDERISKQTKREVTLEPGDAVNATLEVLVDDISSVRALNDGSNSLEDVLVLRVTDGRDHFISIRGTWLQSCLGRSIEELTHIPEGGVRALLPRPRNEPGPPVNRGQEVSWSTPRELIKLTQVLDSLTDRVVADSNMLEGVTIPRDAPGWPFDEKSWRFKDESARKSLRASILHALDADGIIQDTFPPEVSPVSRLEVVAEVLLLFLRSLTDGIIPANLWEKLEADIISRGGRQPTDTEETKAWVLDVLSASPHHNISFVFLTSTLSRVAGELAPIPKVRRSLDTAFRGGFDTVKRTLSWKGRAPPPVEDPAAVRRREVNRAFAEVFAGVVFRGKEPVKEKDRRILEERRRDILEAFIKGLVGM
ncbi:endonuclease Exonuclease phosphatase protein [Rutstroemia sp. NJR-2017a WRK4]|nr:endonuclease Exonuclease phosphatase protein [Rutstroemia sp. NJR-2017a WRK4]